MAKKTCSANERLRGRYQKRGGRVSPKPAKMSKCNKQSSFTGSKRFFGASD
jgi:hypothetical protein